MLYRNIPKTGENLSVLGFGCMRLAQKDGRIDEELATAQVRRAIDCGVNYLDTAWPYHAGESEPFLGRALSGGYRERVKLATKLPAWLVKSPADMDRFLNAQLKKLATEKIDYYLVHSMAGDSWDRIKALGVADFLDRAKAAGKIANAGFSYHGSAADFRRVADGYPWEFCQIQYNYLDVERQAGAEGLRYAASKGLGVIVMEPLRGGILAGEPPAGIAALWREAARSRTPAEWALRWIWNQPEVTVVLSGMNDDAQLAENLKIASEAYPGSLTAAECELVGRAGRKYREIMRVDCTGCGYCQPCPAGVDIPGCFDAFNKFHTFGRQQEAGFSYALGMGGVISGKPAYASLCARCMDCMEKCPQGLDIPNLLEEVAKQFETPELGKTEAMLRHVFAS